ncbi:hypothetical protein [Halosimplex halophilum]|uniref:hypothetical protein n=1 Tax=Halosimplex halophilum TaxID=2559572 RepID=UPI001AE630B3|nr:hypothetical protein [Halosimplex halophilum]
MLAQMGMPGGIELFVILVVAVVVFGLPLVLIAVVGALWLRSDDDYDERIRELETEIARLQAQVGDDGGATADEFADPDATGDRPTDGGRAADRDDGDRSTGYDDDSAGRDDDGAPGRDGG